MTVRESSTPLLPGYHLDQLIAEAGAFATYAATRQADGRKVVTRVIRGARPRAAEIDALRREYEHGREHPLECLLPPGEWVDHPEGVGIELEHRTLKPLLNRRPLGPKAFLDRAIGLTQAVVQLHKRALHHWALHPANCLMDGRGRIVLTGLGHVTEISTETSPPVDWLPYTPPEQTGRLELTPDHRTDLYAVGTIFYELLTGTPPFSSDDPSEVIHAHLAREPRPPTDANPQTPATVAAIVLKLLAKTPAERYQTATGLLADLRRAQREWEDSGTVGPWIPGAEEQQGRLAIPDTLYGRSRELDLLYSAYGNVAAGDPQWWLVAGAPGIGKTSLTDALRGRVVAAGGNFVSGKFEEARRHIPYSALIAALSTLVRQLLKGDEAQLGAWRERFQHAMGGNIRTLIEVIPDLELVTGPQRPVPALPPVPARQRLELAFRSLLATFARREQPLVLFLDDLQWIDRASLRLLQSLAADKALSHLMLIGSFRDNEVDRDHPLSVALDQVESSGQVIHRLGLTPLSADALSALLADVVGGTANERGALAQWVAQQTDGNPFFVRQLLVTLYDSGLLRFDESAGHWRWDLGLIDNLGLSGNVVAFMARRLEALPGDVVHLLKLAACLGARFDVETLSGITGRSRSETEANLRVAAETQLVLPIPGGDGSGSEWRFSHDRVQHAAYSMAGADERAALHLRIGRFLWRHSAGESGLFDIANQLEHGLHLIDDTGERLELARLYLDAGVRAKRAAAQDTARTHLRHAMALLPERPWADHYTLACKTFTEALECEYVAGDYEEADRLFAAVLENAHSAADKASAYGVKLDLVINSGDPLRGLDLGAECLALFGIHLPVAPAEIEAAVRSELDTVRALLEDREIEALIDLPSARDADHLVVADVLTRLHPTAFMRGIDLVILVVLKQVAGILRHGHTPSSPSAFVNYGMILGTVYGEYERGERFARLALSLAERKAEPGLRTGVHQVYGGFVCHWTRPAGEGVRHLYAGVEDAIEGAELVYAALNISFLFKGRLLKGDRLDDILAEWPRFRELLERLRFKAVSDLMQLTMQWIAALKGRTQGPTRLSDTEFDEQRALERLLQSPMKSPCHWYFLLKAQLSYLAGDFDGAKAEIDEAGGFLPAVFAQLAVPEHYFYQSLIVGRLYPGAQTRQRRDYRSVIEGNLERMALWAGFAPSNFEHKWLLLEAERERLFGESRHAADLYERAVRSAAEHGYLQNKAIAHELAALYYLESGFKGMARAHMTEAHYTFERWGATDKARRLAESYPELIAEAASVESQAPDSAASDGRLADLDPLDVVAVTRASLAVAGEIRLDQLLQRLMRIVVENAGARTCILVLNRGERLTIEATADADDGVRVLQSREVTSDSPCALSVLNYVRRSRQHVALDDAALDRVFGDDPHILRHKTKSLLCMPIMRQGGTLGLLYLENELAAGAFTAKRLAVLELLTSQAATALENALLYEDLSTEIKERRRAEDEVRRLNRDLEQRVATRTAELQAVNQELESFAYSVSHDLRAPLRAIGGFSEVLEEDFGEVLGGEGMEHLGRIRRGTRRMSTMIDAMLQLSRVTRGLIRQDDLDLSRLAAEVIEELRLSEPERAVNVEIQPRLEARGDPRLIRILLDNLLGNAWKYSAQRQPAVIRFGSRETDRGGPAYFVSDNGSGFSMEDADRLFVAFQRLHQGDQVAGSGIGLATVQRIVRRHGGQIWAEGEPDRGATFFFTLERARH